MSSGKYRSFEKQPQRCFPWPQRGGKAAFDRWYKLAGTVLQYYELKLAFFPTCPKHMNFRTGEIWVTLEEAAAEAGWSTKTINRNIHTMVDIGLFISKLDRCRNDEGQWKTLRGLRLSLPQNMPEGIDASDVWMDYCSPPADDLWMDYCSPLTLVERSATSAIMDTPAKRERARTRR